MNKDFVMAAAQTKPVKGDTHANIEDHLSYIKRAAEYHAKVIIFPELSLTGYEPELAAELVSKITKDVLKPFFETASKFQMTIVVGAPVAKDGGKPYIGSLVIKPEASEPLVYKKNHLHTGEDVYFSAGDEICVLDVEGVKVGLAICADIATTSHAERVAKAGASVYAPGVFITPEGYAADAELLRSYAEKQRMAVLMANYVGESGGMAAAGRSALWDERGRLVVTADENKKQLVIARLKAGVWGGSVIDISL